MYDKYSNILFTFLIKYIIELISIYEKTNKCYFKLYN